MKAAMAKKARILLVGLFALAACRSAPQPPLDLGKGRPKPAGPRAAERPRRQPSPLDQVGTFRFDGVPLPEAISKLAKELRLAVTVSPTLPASEWEKHRVTLRMKGVSRRAFFDWLVRPLQAQYAVEADGSVWLSRSDDLLDDEPLEVRSYRVPTHLTSTKPVRGLLVFEREQAAVVETLQACLRYVVERRPGCRIAFHGGQDVLVARLPARGHARLAELLDAIRYGTGLPELPKPSALELREKLDATFAWDAPPGPANATLLRIAEAADVNLGWDAAALAERMVIIPPGKHTLRQMLDAMVRQTPLGRHEAEPGHGIWLYLKKQDESFPSSGAVPWDRAVVRAYDVRAILPHTTPEALLAHVRKLVDPGDWARGLPAAAVFVPNARLIAVHDQSGQSRSAAVVRELAERARTAPVLLKEKAK